MKRFFKGKSGGFVAFLIIATLMVGGLGWATSAALRLEREQLEERRHAEVAERLRLALWRLDSRISPLLAREDSRPYDHFSAISAPPVAFDNVGRCQLPGTVLQPSPLLAADLPDWMLLHFLVHPNAELTSPQVPPETILFCLEQENQPTMTGNVTDQRQQLLERFSKVIEPTALIASARERTASTLFRERTLVPAGEFFSPFEQQQAAQPQAVQAPNNPGYPNQASQRVQEDLVNEFNARSISQFRAMQNKAPQRLNRDLITNNTALNGMNWIATNPKKVSVGAEVLVQLSPLVTMWLSDKTGNEHLVAVRLVKIEHEELYQCIALDADALRKLLHEEIRDLFPKASFLPVREAVPPRPERTMTALPFELIPDSGSFAVEGPGWTPLRVGLALAWAAALVALLAVGLGGWSLIDLSERRIGFVSAVTHELRTPLTTLRLYLDMLTGGMVQDEEQRREYLETLHAEADRLNRLVCNVLDFSKLENQNPHIVRSDGRIIDLFEQLENTWSPRCTLAEKDLHFENHLDEEAILCTDHELLQQVLGNLLDNACKYSRGAEDARIWVRVRQERNRMVFEVEDRGPGVPIREQRSIFRAFRRGRRNDATGGVGLGLALACRWAKALGGTLTLESPAEGGASFRLSLPC